MPKPEVNSVQSIGGGEAATRASAYDTRQSSSQSQIAPAAEQAFRREMGGAGVGLSSNDSQRNADQVIRGTNNLAESASRGDLKAIAASLTAIIGMLEKLLQQKEKQSPEQGQQAAQGSGASPSGSGAPAGGAAASDAESDAGDEDNLSLIKKIIAMLKKLGVSDKAIEGLLSSALKGSGLESQIPQLMASMQAPDSQASGPGSEMPRGALAG